VKILCLIIDATPHGCWQETYEVHRRVWNKCLDRCSGVDGYFLRSDPGLAADRAVEGRRFTVHGDERHATILFKTRKAIEVLLTDHDYVVRTNVSSLYDFPLLRQQDLPDKDLYLGHIVDGKYVTGSGMILSRDAAQKLLSPTSQPLDAWDDVAIGQILHAHGVAARHKDAFIYDYARGLDQVSVGQNVHYRLRDHDDPQRVKEREVTEHVFSKIYA
jgi:hypothetical protein